METIISGLNGFWAANETPKKSAPATSGFVRLLQQHKLLSFGLLNVDMIYDPDKTGLHFSICLKLPFCCLKLSICQCITFKTDVLLLPSIKNINSNKKQWKLSQ